MGWLVKGSLLLLGLSLPLDAFSDPVSLQEYLFDLNGSLYSNTTLVPGLASGGFDAATGLGTLVLTFVPGSGGAYFFDAYFDHEIGVPFYDEYGTTSGVPSAGTTWQIDEPGFGDGNRLGTIFANASGNALDNVNHVPGTTSNFLGDCGGNAGGNPDPSCNNDVSLALGFNFVLGAGEKAVITLDASRAPPLSGFYLEQLAASQPGEALFLSGAISISQAPEPASSLLTLTGLIGLALRARCAR